MRIIAGQAHGRRLKAPRGLATRPTSARARESIFSRLSVRMDFAAIRVLDIFAGSGSLGIESLSRGAGHVTFVDSARAAASVIRQNLKSLGFQDSGRILVLEVRRALAEVAAAGETFDLAFVDAPYKNDISAEVVVTLARLELIERDGWVVVEQSKRAPALPPSPGGLERINIATLGDHRIAFYRRPSMAPSES
ncbi:MAG TPA: 16S rRNA (guanine(966)-N(2))-methyltransferase RsmD [Candidatus Binataceae bacterium]